MKPGSGAGREDIHTNTTAHVCSKTHRKLPPLTEKQITGSGRLAQPKCLTYSKPCSSLPSPPSRTPTLQPRCKSGVASAPERDLPSAAQGQTGAVSAGSRSCVQTPPRGALILTPSPYFPAPLPRQPMPPSPTILPSPTTLGLVWLAGCASAGSDANSIRTPTPPEAAEA